MINRTIIIIFSFLILLITFIAGVLLYYENYLYKNVQTLEVNIEKGEPYSETYEKIFENVKTPPFFDIYLRIFLDFDKKRKYGFYYAENITIKEFLKDIMSAKEYLIKIVIIEGLNIYDIASLLDDKGIVSKKKFINECFNKPFIKSLTNLDIISIEGFLYPDTYYFPKSSGAKKIIEKMYHNFMKNLPPGFPENIKKNGLTFYEGITLASIIQKESYIDDEYPIIASVFYNRLKRNMKLQADPTVIYGIYRKFNGNLKRVDLEDRSNKYNTYIYKGLPPTPICNPSKEALKAVINPADTNYYYFVAKGDGRHYFSRTYQEHLSKIRQLYR
ncbi:MAG: endolytic transglycosylase MltG [Deferribacterota bacterium]|nr:endolytic transglycosylase MltG [Deferribacterota bacterium]